MLSRCLLVVLLACAGVSGQPPKEKAKVEEPKAAEVLRAKGAVFEKEGKAIVAATLIGLKLADADLAPLAELNDLRTLDLSGSTVGDAGLAHAKGLTQLTTLDLRGTGESAVPDDPSSYRVDRLVDELARQRRQTARRGRGTGCAGGIGSDQRTTDVSTPPHSYGSPETARHRHRFAKANSSTISADTARAEVTWTGASLGSLAARQSPSATI